ncbi:MAG: hypothetical protein V7719_11120 [Psychroserpens sp.]|uniref:hypothetical protein n=1 Tax=Psychroserpens sp. TaxID=2020870 RepID=UPI003001AEBB
MSENKHIDKLFKEQLKNFEVAPNDAVWENIERELHKDKRKKRRIIPIWWKIGGIAAALVLMFTVGKAVLSDDSNTQIERQVVDTETSEKDNTNHSENKLNTSKEANTTVSVATSEKEKENSTSNKSSIIKHKSQQKDAVVNTDAQLPKRNKDKSNVTSTTKNAIANRSNEDKLNKDVIQNPIKKEESEIDKLIKETTNSKDTQVTSSNVLEKENANTTIDSSATKEAIEEENAIENAIADAEKEEDKIEDIEEPIKRWSVAPNVAPVYFNTLGKGSTIDDQFVNNTKEGDVNMSYGIRGGYAVNKKLKIRAGINKVDLGYSTKNILVFDGTGLNAAVSSNLQLGHVRFHDSIVGNNAYVSANSVSFTTGPEILFTKEQGSIDQQLGFIEVPIEIEYSLIDKKIGVNLIGGFSTFFLNNNEIYAVQNNGDRTLLGEATNINDLSYSANFGVGVNYRFSKQLQFNLEPTFKYQINTFNDTSGDFQPFFIGVYTGLSFKF